MKRWIVVLFMGLAVASASGCTSYRVEGPGAYSHQGVVVTPQALEVHRKKLRLRFTFANHTTEEITVDRNQMVLVLPDGQVMGRFKGTWGGLTSGHHRIAPGLSHDVFMDFLIEDDIPPTLSLKLSGVIQGGKPMSLPNYELTISEE
jgi:hypothetical protein